MFSYLFMLSTLTLTSGFFIEVPQGSVGVHYVTGVLQDKYLEPGWHTYMPGYSRIEFIDIRYQTDEFNNIECGSEDGNNLIFSEVKVVNHLQEQHVVDVVRRYDVNYDRKLLYDVIEQTIREMCASMTLDEIYRTKFDTIDETLKNELVSFQESEKSNLLIKRVNVKKPMIEDIIQKNYDDTTEEKSRQKKELEIQKRRLIEEQTKKLLEEQEGLKKKSVSQISYLMKIEEEESEAKLQKVKAESEALLMKISSEAVAMEIGTLAEANSKKFTREYLQWHWQENVLKNADAFYGSELPKFVLQQKTTDSFTTTVTSDV